MNKMLKILCGFDVFILNNMKRNDFVLYFSLSLSITFLSFISISKAVHEILDNYFGALFIGIFSTLFIINLFRLILSSINRGDQTFESRTNSQKLFPHLIKFFSLLVLAVMISYPLEIIIFKNQINSHLKIYKSEIVREYSRILENINTANIEEMIMAFEEEKQFLILINEPEKIRDFKEIKEEIVLIEKQMDMDISQYKNVVAKSTFFAHFIKIINNKIPLSYFFTLLIIGLFFTPLLLILLNNDFVEYFKLKNKINTSLIKSEYSDFTVLRDQLYIKSTGKEINIRQNFSDPPFNLIPIENNINYLKKGSLLEWFKLNNQN